ncbi:hypothetical protein NQZ68_008055 [Dissostichus eleginoides]|nr:hypothetical protein NQZ68_008055 [Dissostichus eleginoides]
MEQLRGDKREKQQEDKGEKGEIRLRHRALKSTLKQRLDSLNKQRALWPKGKQDQSHQDKVES